MRFLQGRINRAVYWLGLGVIVVIVAALALLAPKDAHISEVVLIFLAVPRLHDLGRTGWWVLGPLALEVLVLILAIGQNLPLDETMLAFGIVTLVILALLVLLGALPGQRDANRFGDAPRPGLGLKRAPTEGA